ncbi:MAG: hypothetical protein ACK4ND_09250 [Cytophagaceae bacterium]
MITTLSVFFLSIIITLILPNYYKASVRFYPYTIKASDPRLAFTGLDYEVIGEDEDFERIISIGTSRRMYEYLIKKFELYNHYEIDSTKIRFPYTEITKQLKDNYEIRKTDKGLQVTVYDRDPVFSANMANTIVEEIEKINTELIMYRNLSMVDLYKNFIDNSHKQIQTINDSIITLRQGSSLDEFNAENKVLAFNKRGSKINTSSISSAEEVLNFKKNFELIKRFDTQIQELSKELAAYELMYTQSVSALSNPFKTLVVIEEAVPAERKAKPVRSLIVLLSTIGAFILFILAILCIEYYQTELKKILSE